MDGIKGNLKTSQEREESGQVDLPNVAVDLGGQLLPTPTASDYKGANTSGKRKRKHSKHRHSCCQPRAGVWVTPRQMKLRLATPKKD
jgi:hypothetical protein